MFWLSLLKCIKGSNHRRKLANNIGGGGGAKSTMGSLRPVERKFFIS